MSLEFPVFISYARIESRNEAVALHAALGVTEGLAFLDTQDTRARGALPRSGSRRLLVHYKPRLQIVFF
jgi:hypothetical protein